MKRFQLKSREINKKELLRKRAAESDTDIIFDQPGVYSLDGTPVIIYGKLKPDDQILAAVMSLGFQGESRSTAGGAIGQRDREKLGASRIFGFRPRIPFGANYCAVSSSWQTHPEQHATICEFGKRLDKIYEKRAPKVAARHSEQLKAIAPEWILPGTRFTSGIVNNTNPLKYHFDRGNLLKVMSCMVVFRELCSGGFLSIPEFNARWMLSNNSYFLFDGQSHLHGVTPIKKINKNGYRYSVVYYALKAMATCGTLDQELDRARKEKRRREKKRVTPVETPSS